MNYKNDLFMKNRSRFQFFDKEPILNRMGCMPPLVATMVIVGLLFLSSCATKTRVEYRDRDVIKYETKFVHDTLKESVHDSVFHTIYVKGDTVYNTKYIEKTKWRDKIVEKYDTCWRDSVTTITKETTIEKKVVPRWCYGCLAICLIFIIFAVKKVITWLTAFQV